MFIKGTLPKVKESFIILSLIAAKEMSWLKV